MLDHLEHSQIDLQAIFAVVIISHLFTTSEYLQNINRKSRTVVNDIQLGPIYANPSRYFFSKLYAAIHRRGSLIISLTNLFSTARKLLSGHTPRSSLAPLCGINKGRRRYWMGCTTTAYAPRISGWRKTQLLSSVDNNEQPASILTAIVLREARLTNRMARPLSCPRAFSNGYGVLFVYMHAANTAEDTTSSTFLATNSKAKYILYIKIRPDDVRAP